jgi:uncharacterized protein YbjT (DUF2867 family)
MGLRRAGVGTMKVLLTGGTGFVGAHSVAALVSQGHQIRLLALSRDQVAYLVRHDRPQVPPPSPEDCQVKI